MSYRVLSLKWRPKKLEELEGQKAIKQILTGAVKSQSIHPVFIFAGPRGTGKTSTARILAKALRCQTRKGAEPCCECSICLSIQDGCDMDVVEIDGASNNGVDAVRELKDSIQYMPHSGSRKIYIIDEVHMLSQSAFNALLKTLEEPPAHITFVLATTELNKIPLTVSSRCQILRFHSIPSAVIQKKLKSISRSENIEIDAEALWLISEQAQNSLRDALVLLDQMACLENKKISSEKVIQTLGLTRRSVLNSILKAVIDQDTKNILTLLADLSSAHPQTFLENLLIQIRNLTLIKTTSEEDSSDLVFLTDLEKDFLNNIAQKTTTENLHLLFDMCLKGLEDLAKSFNPHITLEMILLRMGEAPRVEEVLAAEAVFPPVQVKTSTDKTPPQTLDSKKHLSSGKEKPSNFGKDLSSAVWPEFIQFTSKKHPKTTAVIRSFSLCRFSCDEVVLGYPAAAEFLKSQSQNKAFQIRLKEYLFEFFGRNITLKFIPADKTSSREESAAQQQSRQIKNIQKAASHPLAKKVSHLFQAQVQVPSKHHLMK